MKKKIIIGLIGILVIAGILIGIYKLNIIDNGVSFSVSEQQWLSNNKNNIIDIYVPSDISIFSNMGKGVVFDLINDFSNDNKIKINATAYELQNNLTDISYAIELVDKVGKDQILLYKDSYALVVKDDKKYNNISNISNLKLGVLNQDLDLANSYFGDNNEISGFANLEELNSKFISGDESLDGVIVLRSLYLQEILEHNYHIAYHISEMTKNFVITTKGDKILNNIFQKYTKNWLKENIESSYNAHLLDEYFTIKGITDKEKNSLQEKTYTYGYINNGIYDFTSGNDLYGINYYIIKAFAKLANIDMDYHKPYKTAKELNNALEQKKIDFYFNDIGTKCTNQCFSTIDAINSDIVFLTNVNNDFIINSLASLQNQKINVVKNSMIAKYLKENKIKVKEYDNINKLLSNVKKTDILALDLKSYEYYSDELLRLYKIQYIDQFKLNYGYIINEDNKTFMNLFNFYLEYTPIHSIVNRSYGDIYVKNYNQLIMFVVICILSLIVIFFLIRDLRKFIKIIKKRKHKTLSKQEKLKYIDQLTSLKNRAYLNDNIELWDASLIYPQAIAVIDLNNIAYINDNFGHEEGDKVIAEAANILIRTQLPRTEIIRTDGNEFLVYMIEYNEKQIVSYLKKITKEFKELTHGYGAAMGYSIINDEIKTIDDAVNEATIAMKEHKQSMMSDE